MLNGFTTPTKQRSAKMGLPIIDCADYGICDVGFITPHYGGGVWYPFDDIDINFPEPNHDNTNLPDYTTNTNGGTVTTTQQVSCNCLVGEPYIENDVCKCCDGVLVGNVCTGGIKSPVNNQPQTTTPTTTNPTMVNPSDAIENILDIIKDHPYIALGAGAGLLFLLFGNRK